MLKPTPSKPGLFSVAFKRFSCLRGIAVVAFVSLVFAVTYLVSATPQVAYATTASTLNFQARLESSSGAIAPDGTYNVEFKLYNVSSGGSAEWTEDYLVSATQGVKVANGYLTVNLGSINAFSNASPAINWGQPLYLTMNIGNLTSCSPFSTCSPDGEMSPRLPLTSVPSAFSLQSPNSGSFTSTLSFVQPTASESILLPAESGSTETVCYQNDTNCGFAPTTLGTGYIQNGTSQQTSANFNIAGEGQLATLDATGSGTGNTLTIGSTAVSSTGGVINVGTSDVAGTINVGGTTQTGQITIGQSTASNSISIGAATPGAGNTQTINIGSNNAAGGTTNVKIGTGTSATAGTTTVQAKGTLTLTGTGGITESGAAASSITTSSGALTLTSAAQATWSTSAGNLILQAGSGTVSLGTSTVLTAAGALTIEPGSATALNVGTANANAINLGATGVTTTIEGGLVYTPSSGFSSGTNNATVTASLLTNNTVVPVSATVAGLTFNLPTTGLGSAGRIVYITNGGTNSFLFNIGPYTMTFATTSSATLYWNGTAWSSAGLDAGITTMGAFDGQASSATGATILDNALFLQSATASNPGLVNANTGSTQIFAGPKQFNGLLTANAGLTAGNGAIALTGNTISSFTTSSGALTLTSGASATWSTSAGSLAITGATTLALNSTGANAVTLDSGTTGTVNIGISANSKTIQIGATNSAITDTIAIGNNTNASGISTVTIGSTKSTSATTINAGSGNITLNGFTTINQAGIPLNVNSTGGTPEAGITFQLAGTNEGEIGIAGSTGHIINQTAANDLALKSINGNVLFAAGSSSVDLTLATNGNLTLNTGLLVLLNASSAPTEVNGGMYYSTSDGTFECGVNGSWTSCGNGLLGVVSSNTSINDVTSTSYTSFNGANFTPPAGDCQVGVTYLITAYGFYNTTVNEDLKFELTQAGTDVEDMEHSGTLTTNSSGNNTQWELSMQVTCQDTANTAMINGMALFDDNNNPNIDSVVMMDSPAGFARTGTVSITDGGTWQLKGRWVAHSSGGTFFCTSFTAQRLAP